MVVLKVADGNFTTWSDMAEFNIVGDIGSTKSSWRSSWHTEELHLPGYNPLTHGDGVIDDIIGCLAGWSGMHNPKQIWYYGAGVVDDASREKITKRFLAKFPETKILVESDLLGAARAACGSTSGTIALLGTGSHAALYDGAQITKQASSLGFILGDEGSGADIGKEMIRAYFYRQMPERIALEMDTMMPEGGRGGFLQKLNSIDSPNTFLAQFAQPAARHTEDEWVRSLVTNRLRAFTRLHLMPLQPTINIHIIGSIGFIFAGLLQDVLKESGLEAREFIQHPLTRLAQFHFDL